MSLKSGIVAEERRIECVRTTARESMNATITLNVMQVTEAAKNWAVS